MLSGSVHHAQEENQVVPQKFSVTVTGSCYRGFGQRLRASHGADQLPGGGAKLHLPGASNLPERGYFRPERNMVQRPLLEAGRH